VAEIVTEAEFRVRLYELLAERKGQYGCVTGPGRSGAIAAVYSSHFLGVPMIPHGMEAPRNLRPCLVVDTAKKTGATLRRAARLAGPDTTMMFLYDEPPRVIFWYERDAIDRTEPQP
jgi:hypothetical protein